MIYPLVHEFAATGTRVRVPVVVTCRVLGFSNQAYYGSSHLSDASIFVKRRFGAR